MLPQFGTYQLTYTPQNKYETEYVEPTIHMSISAEADLSQMVEFFDSFLKASGYVYEGSLKVVKKQPTFKDTVITGSAATDTIFFGAAQPAMDFRFGNTMNDVISFE